MQFSLFALRRNIILVIVFCLVAFVATTHGQSGQPQPDQTDDVLRIKTELVQTDVMVFDRQGHFVDSLRPEQFELSMDGKPRPISFFEQVNAGSATEATQLAAARGLSATRKEARRTNNAEATDHGRLIFFFLDDVHLGGESLVRAREALTHFIDERMTADDQVAIVSTSGQIGFLQQLTDNRAVLRAAIARLNYKQNSEAYTGKTQISEYAASQILDYGNRELFAYLLESTKIEQQMGPGNRQGDHRLASSYSATTYLRNRLQQVNAQGRMTTDDTLGSLRSLILSSKDLPGRKLVFFLSDGFLVNERKAGTLEMLHSVTQAAASTGAVVYTMDLRGTLFGLGSGVDASTNDYVDLSGRRSGLLLGETTATQEPLHILADETGGRAILNSNSLSDGISQAIRETSAYYVLAWRPDSEEQRSTKSRLKITIKDHPELRLRWRSNYDSMPFAQAAETVKPNNLKASPTQTRSPEVEMLSALGALHPQRALPVSLAVGYVNTSAGTTLKVSMQLGREAFYFDPDAKEQKMLTDVMGVAVDDRGLIYSFKQLLTVTPDSSPQSVQHPVVWNQQLQVKPGLYQVRVAVRERLSGRVGSTMQWIEIPDTSQGRFALSTLFLGERNAEEATVAKSAAPSPIMIAVDHRFTRSSVLRFQTYVYNSARSASGIDVWIQAQVFRNGQQVMITSPDKVPTTSDLARLPYWTEIPLNQLPAGRYVLQVSATDRVNNSTASQQVNFSIE